MSHPLRLLDVFCGAGGCAVGYHRAGYTDITGVDIKPQPRYPFAFHEGDALEFLAGVKPGDFDLIHASPPCPCYSVITPEAHKHKHPDLIEPVRARLLEIGTPYVIENVPGARKLLRDPWMLCGSMFGLKVWRHRYFEAPDLPFTFSPYCVHDGHPVLVTGTPKRNGIRITEPTVAERSSATGIDWMTKAELDDAIPPAYCEWVGRQMLGATQ